MADVENDVLFDFLGVQLEMAKIISKAECLKVLDLYKPVDSLKTSKEMEEFTLLVERILKID